VRVTLHRVSYSQFGEDMVIEALLTTHRRIDAGTYVDVGAFDPWRYSNTALLHTAHGWRGVNIDPSSDAIAAFVQERPDDRNIVSLVGRPDREVEYVRFNHPAVNTADPGMIARQLDERTPFEELSREVLTPVPLRELLDAHLDGRTVDFLNVDAEGMDLEVLETNDWNRYRPFLLAVEVHGLQMDDPAASTIHRFLQSVGYRWVSHVFVTSLFMPV